MRSSKKIRRIFTKTLAITEKNIQIQIRYKFSIILRYFIPILMILMPIIVFDKFFDYNMQFGPWTPENYLVFICIGFNIMLMRSMITYIPRHLLREKYWKTLPALITAPFNRYYLLSGYILSEFLEILLPFALFFVVTLIFIPVSISTLIIIFLMFFGIGIVFSGVGLFLGVFAISNENFLYIFDFCARVILWFSCVSYPFQIYPPMVQSMINMNPIYYLIDIIRLTWIENNFILTVLSHPIHIIIFAISIVLFPIICVYVFNKIYKKLGISGY